MGFSMFPRETAKDGVDNEIRVERDGGAYVRTVRVIY